MIGSVIKPTSTMVSSISNGVCRHLLLTHAVGELPASRRKEEGGKAGDARPRQEPPKDLKV